MAGRLIHADGPSHGQRRASIQAAGSGRRRPTGRPTSRPVSCALRPARARLTLRSHIAFLCNKEGPDPYQSINQAVNEIKHTGAGVIPDDADAAGYLELYWALPGPIAEIGAGRWRPARAVQGRRVCLAGRGAHLRAGQSEVHLPSKRCARRPQRQLVIGAAARGQGEAIAAELGRGGFTRRSDPLVEARFRTKIMRR